MSVPDDDKNNSEKALTSIHDNYTLSATDEEKGNEVDELIIKKFLVTLADVALSVAARNINEVKH